MSTLAGFVEPGEGIEETVVREVYEEVGIKIVDLRYRGSQPWPFPGSLMLAFAAEADANAQVRLDQGELESARWFTREDLAGIRGLGLKLPPRDSIGRMLIEEWWHREER
ncbi:MAG: NUDIX domain-containing protein [Rhodospirillales bacterium]|nr:NUDIX domain-containing protein [Rhodospirillales bacterium]